MQTIRCCPEAAKNDTNRFSQEICSRHVLVFGDEIQRLLSDLTIGVVSVGGLGSVIIELLMRLFPKRLIYIDKDIVEQSNLNRLIGATPIDVKIKASKTDVASRNILSFNPNQNIQSITGDFLEKTNQEAFRECDFIFGASDSNAVRIAANRLCLAHGIPYLDCGTGALIENATLTAAGGQVIKILPDAGFCLHCSGLFDVKNAMQEFLSNKERERQEAQGYIKGQNIAAPQVYSLNMMVASWALWIFKRMISGEELDFDGLAIDAKKFQTYFWKEPSKRVNDCPTCGPKGIVFHGDDVDLLSKEDHELEVDISASDRMFAEKNEASEEVRYKIESELPIHPFSRLILGKDESTPFNFGLW